MAHNFCPCNKCICIAVCRHKSWDNLRFDCSLMSEYIRNFSLVTGHYYKKVIYSILSPTEWDVDDSGYFVIIKSKGGTYE